MLYSIDKDGLVVNEASKERIQERYKSAIQELLLVSKAKLKKNFQSFYIRGSVSVGKAIPSISDLDVVVFVYKEIEVADINWFSNYSQRMGEKYPFITFFDVTVITLKQLSESVEYSNLKIYLKTQSFCLDGEEILPYLPTVAPGKELALLMYGEKLIKELYDLRSVIGGNTIRKYHNEEKSLEFWCIWTMRVLLRSGLGLVMISKPVYSQDLRTCCDVFCAEYPQYSENMIKALSYALNPIKNRDELTSFLDNFVPQFIKLWQKFINQ